MKTRPQRAIRHYVQSGLIQPPLTRGRYARYHRDTLARLLAIEHLRQEGSTLQEIDSLFRHHTRSSVIEFVESSFDRERLQLRGKPRGTTGELITLLSRLRKGQPHRGSQRRASHETSGTWIRIQVTDNLEIGAKMEGHSMDERKLRQVAMVLRQMILEADQDPALFGDS